MRTKLTLSVGAKVVARAKRYAARRNTSVSKLVEEYLALVSRPGSKTAKEDPPVLRLMRGVARARGKAFAREALETFLGAFQVAPVDGRVLKQALSMAWPDFEDAVTAAAAAAARCDLLVTRDPGGFKGSRVRVLDPRSAAALLRADESPTDA